MIGLLIATLIIGLEDSVMGKILSFIEYSQPEEEVKMGFFAFIVLSIVNFIPEYFSLEETRIILNISHKYSYRFIFVAVDIILTSVIFIVPVLIFYILIIDISNISELYTETIYVLSEVFNTEDLLVIYMTTFFYINYMDYINY